MEIKNIIEQRRQRRQDRFTHRKNRNENGPKKLSLYYLILRMLEIMILRIWFSIFCERMHVCMPQRPPKLQEALHPSPPRPRSTAFVK